MMKKLLKNLSNLPGWRTKRKIVVFESDDWGAIRMPSVNALNNLTKAGILPFDEDERRYLENDSLASESDLERLFEVLSSVKDVNGNHPVFTALALVANPDFKKIKESNYTQYFYEPFTETLKKYPEHSRSFDLWKQGIKEHLFVPQFHGREHLNVQNWLKALRKGNTDTITAFENEVYGITPRNAINHISYQAAFDIGDKQELIYQKSVLKEGLDLFEQLFGYRSTFFVPTNGPFNNSLEETLYKNGVKYIGASKIQNEPLGDQQFKKRFNFIGKRNAFQQIYLTRNCFFEPSSNLESDWVISCLGEIEIAFRWHKPAVISSHRVNYTGFLQLNNREKGLKSLDKLLKAIVSEWPDAEFVTSNELGEIISGISKTEYAQIETLLD